MKTLFAPLLSLLMIVLACATAFSQGSIVSSATDGFAVPTAATSGLGNVTVGLFTVTDGDDKSGYSLTVGVSDEIDVFIDGVFDGFIRSDHERIGAKWQFMPASIADRGVQLAAFCYDVRNGVNPKPGLAATWTGPNGLSFGAAGLRAVVSESTGIYLNLPKESSHIVSDDAGA